jgi:hypothetical protein
LRDLSNQDSSEQRGEHRINSRGWSDPYHVTGILRKPFFLDNPGPVVYRERTLFGVNS